MTEVYTFRGKEYMVDQLMTVHGGPFDRGSADSYYQRGSKPHYWPEGYWRGNRVVESEMSKDEIDEYLAGWWYNEDVSQSFKDWG